MVKYLLNSLFVFLMLSSFSFAKNDTARLQAKLEKEFGYDLTHAPFFLRFAYSKEFNKDWKKTDYAQRRAFLTDYEINLAAEQVREKAEAKAAADREKEILLAQKEEKLREHDRLKALAAEEKAEQEAVDERQKEFNASVSEQQKDLQQMKKTVTQGNN